MISVIIPLWNRVDLTLNCLGSIEAAETVGEIVLVDNGSADATAELDVSIRNARNLGFAAACNQGAAEATGDHLIFLNNDTLVHHGWTRIAQHDGIAGPKLLYPDGTIQHAGVGVDFTRAPGLEAWNRRDEWTDRPAIVKAVTGACLAIPRDLFFQLDGFDEGYWNGYEDVDLCLKAGGAVYDPNAVVTHLESQSGPERWTAVQQNVLRLRQKWGTQ